MLITSSLIAGAFLLATGRASADTIYVAEGSSSDDNIYGYTPTGVQTFATSGMNYAFGLGANRAGDVFVANDAQNNGETGNLTEITPGGMVNTFAAGIDPQNVAFDNSGNLYETDWHSGNVYEYTNNSGTLNSTKGTFASGFSFPLGLAFNTAGDLFVGAGYGAGNGTITEITPGGGQTPFASGLTFPTGIAINSAGDLFVCEQGTGIIEEFAPGGGAGSTYITLPETDLDGLAFDSIGDLFVAGGNSDKVIEISPNKTTSIFETESGPVDGVAVVPEPATPALAGLGAGAMLMLRRKKS